MPPSIVQLEAALAHLQALGLQHIKATFGQAESKPQVLAIPTAVRQCFSEMVGEETLSDTEFYVLLVALVPHLQPTFFDELIDKAFQQPTNFLAFGGVRGKHRCFIPTVETLLFLIGKTNLKDRFETLALFEEAHFFTKKNILQLGDIEAGTSLASSKLILAKEYVDLFLFGTVAPPKFSKDFPAERIGTPLSIDDLILNKQTYQHILELENWIQHGTSLQQDARLGRHLKKGYRALFYGPPGTGKTLTASVLGKRNDKPVYRIDLSLVVSKYIGETEKNLGNLFKKAEHKDWILFFDEADALFGKRTNVKDAHDRYANQEIAYLLQRIENYNGLIIMATNMKSNIDEAFLRRFQAVIQFPMPSANERLQVWQKTLPVSIPLAKDVDLTSLAQKYKISGASIVNIVHFCSLQAKSRSNGSVTLQQKDFITGISRELAKAGKRFSP